MRFGPFSRVVSKAISTIGGRRPPEPAIIPVGGLKPLPGSRPISDRLFHGDNGIGGAVTHEPQTFKSNMVGNIHLDRANLET